MMFKNHLQFSFTAVKADTNKPMHFLVVPTSRLSTVGDRAFPVAAARVWNVLSLSLSRGVISASFLPAFKRRLKTELFLRSFPEVAPTASD